MQVHHYEMVVDLAEERDTGISPEMATRSFIM